MLCKRYSCELVIHPRRPMNPAGSRTRRIRCASSPSWHTRSDASGASLLACHQATCFIRASPPRANTTLILPCHPSAAVPVPVLPELPRWAIRIRAFCFRPPVFSWAHPLPTLATLPCLALLSKSIKSSSSSLINLPSVVPRTRYHRLDTGLKRGRFNDEWCVSPPVLGTCLFGESGRAAKGFGIGEGNEGREWWERRGTQGEALIEAGSSANEARRRCE